MNQKWMVKVENLREVLKKTLIFIHLKVNKNLGKFGTEMRNGTPTSDSTLI